MGKLTDKIREIIHPSENFELTSVEDEGSDEYEVIGVERYDGHTVHRIHNYGEYVTLHSKLEDSPLGEKLKEFLESEGFEVRFEEW